MTIGMRLPPNSIGGKWVAASKPQALGMVANIKLRLNTYLPEGKKTTPPIIGAICAFDAKIYKIVDGVFAVNPCPASNKKF